jgi:hypothetical protein
MFEAKAPGGAREGIRFVARSIVDHDIGDFVVGTDR